jgi:hypothetical protein
MSQAISLALLGVGIVLLIFGINESNSLSSSFSRFFTGSPTDRSVWMLIGGVAAIVIGLVGVVRGKAR